MRGPTFPGWPHYASLSKYIFESNAGPVHNNDNIQQKENTNAASYQQSVTRVVPTYFHGTSVTRLTMEFGHQTGKQDNTISTGYVPNSVS